MQSLLSLQLALAGVLPLVLPFLGSTVAYMLRQDGFDTYMPWLNPLIAWLVLLATAALSAFASGKLSGSPNAAWFAAIAGAVSMLVSGQLHNLSPWLTWLDFVQAHLFAVVKTPPTITSVVAPSAAVPAPAPAPVPNTTATGYSAGQSPVMSVPQTMTSNPQAFSTMTASLPNSFTVSVPTAAATTQAKPVDLTWMNTTYPMAALGTQQQETSQGK